MVSQWIHWYHLDAGEYVKQWTNDKRPRIYLKAMPIKEQLISQAFAKNGQQDSQAFQASSCRYTRDLFGKGKLASHIAF